MKSPRITAHKDWTPTEARTLRHKIRDARRQQFTQRQSALKADANAQAYKEKAQEHYKNYKSLATKINMLQKELQKGRCL